jgi:hypothetical protein
MPPVGFGIGARDGSRAAGSREGSAEAVFGGAPDTTSAPGGESPGKRAKGITQGSGFGNTFSDIRAWKYVRGRWATRWQGQGCPTGHREERHTPSNAANGAWMRNVAIPCPFSGNPSRRGVPQAAASVANAPFRCAASPTCSAARPTWGNGDPSAAAYAAGTRVRACGWPLSRSGGPVRHPPSSDAGDMGNRRRGAESNPRPAVFHRPKQGSSVSRT